MSESNSPVFVVPVEGIGSFTFLRRTMRLQFAVGAEFRRLNEGVPADDFTLQFTQAVADLKVLISDGPPGWTAADIDNLDPDDDEVYARVTKVWSALRDKEETFRAARKALQGAGEAGGGGL